MIHLTARRSAQAQPPAARAAAASELDGITRLVAHWHAAGENLPRSREEIERTLDDFVVATEGPSVIGCGSLVRYRCDLAEIRSLGVDPLHQGGGIGRRVVEALAQRAAAESIATVFVLTRVPAFFRRIGFVPVSMDALPEKVFKDCERCPKRTCCDEQPLILNP